MRNAIALLPLLLILSPPVAHGSAPAPTPSFTISTSNVTMPTTGNGTIPYTLTSLSGFAGTVVTTCTPPNPPPNVLEPQCEGGPITYISLAANADASGSFPLYPYVYVGPTLTGSSQHPGSPGGSALAFVGLVVLGFGLRRPKAQRLTTAGILLASGMLIGLTGLSACGHVLTLTPGTYTYTLSAVDTKNVAAPANTTLQVTVPPGVDVQDAVTTYAPVQ